MSNAIKHITDEMTFFSLRKTAHWCTGIARATQSSCGSLDFLSLKPYPPNSPICTHWLQDLGSHIEQREHESWVKKTEEIKERLVDFWQCTDTAFESNMRFSCFPVFPGSAEAHIIWGGKVKCFLVAHFMANISAKKYQNAFTCVKVIANQR